jgi:hypothetical protein
MDSVLSAATPAEMQGAQGLQAEVMRRLTGGSQIPPLTDLDKYTHQGTFEKIAGLTGFLSPLIGDHLEPAAQTEAADVRAGARVMSQYQFTNPGAMAGLAIARLLADRDEEVHKRREEEQRTKESEARIAAQKDSAGPPEPTGLPHGRAGRDGECDPSARGNGAR